jgi:hypothetical protein
MTIMAPKFSLGNIGITSGAMHELCEGREQDEVIHAMRPLLWKHMHGDWGNVDAHDKRANEDALKTGARIVSSYKLFNVKLWIITDAAWGEDSRVRQVTTILRPSDY